MSVKIRRSKSALRRNSEFRMPKGFEVAKPVVRIWELGFPSDLGFRSSDITRAFTLLELVISTALMSVILIAAYACFHAALAGQKLIEPRAEVIQNARVAMGIISADLRAACPLSKDFEFLGMRRTIEQIQADADNLDFATHNYSPRHAREADYCQVSYFAEKDPASSDLTLYRRRNPTIALDPLSGGSREMIARGLRGVSFEYYDGWEWYDSWGEINPQRTDKKEKAERTKPLAPNLTGMPEAVRVILSFNPNPKPKRSIQDQISQKSEPEKREPPMIFETTIRLNLAAASQRGFAKASGGQNVQTPEGIGPVSK